MAAAVSITTPRFVFVLLVALDLNLTGDELLDRWPRKGAISTKRECSSLSRRKNMGPLALAV